jgi:DNA-binding PadR family transcriptional regulator
MRKWLAGVAVIAAGGVGAFLLTEKGQESLRRWLSAWGSDCADAWNEGAQLELERIQAALNRIAQSLEPGGELGAPSR